MRDQVLVASALCQAVVRRSIPSATFSADRFGHLLRGGLDALGWLRYPSHCTILPCLCISRPENPAPPFAAGGFHFTLRPNILEAPRCWACPVLDGYALLIFSFH